MQDKPVTLAVVTGAHGVTGEVRLKLFADGIESLSAHKAFNGDTLTLAKIRSNKGGAIARFAEIADRNAAEALRGTELAVSRSALPALDEGEYYYIDLIGLPCVDTEGKPVGSIAALYDFGAGDVIEIRLADDKTVMVPMTPEAVPEWNAERLTVSRDFIAV